MLTSLTFRDNRKNFSVSEVTSDDDVSFEIDTPDDDFGFQSFSLKLEELLSLREWINKQIRVLKQS